MAYEEARLICVTDVNNNKYYNMKQISSYEFEVVYGRVDKTKTRRVYDMSKWDTTYDKRMRHGYKDVTHLYRESAPVTTTGDKQTSVTNDTTGLLRKLLTYAKGSISRNYSVTSDKVTQAQIDSAQDILNHLSRLVTEDTLQDIRINDYLLELYHTVPRLMANVKDHLIYPQGRVDDADVKRLVATEQANIDVMAQQVRSNVVQVADEPVDVTIEVGDATDKEIDLVRKEAEEEKHRIRRVYRVVNVDTQASFDADLASALAKEHEHGYTKLLWHGSRNENWLSILDTGLLIRPTGVLTTGSMFGDGIYFAPRFRKSMGYTSVRGSYWASGSSATAYMALYYVRVGKQLRTTKHTSECYRWNRSYLERKGEYDSVYAMKRGGFLHNDENIIYAPSQCTVAYLVEIS